MATNDDARTTFTLYLDQIGRHRLLSRSEEARLARRAAAGDAAARTRLVEGNLRLVVAIARRYWSPGVDLVDLIQEGNLGLISACGRYDARRGVKFSTFASWRIRYAILAGRATQRAADPSLVSLAEPVVDELTLWDVVRDEDAVDPAELLPHEKAADVRAALDRLPRRARAAVDLRFGLDGRREHTLVEVGRSLGVSRERARRLQEQALHSIAAATALRPLARAA